MRRFSTFLVVLVGAARFELATPSPPDWCANRAALRSDGATTIVSGNLKLNIRSPTAPAQRKVLSATCHPSPHASGQSLKRLLSATTNSLRGLLDGVRTEPALRDEAILLVLAVVLGFVVAPSARWYAAMIGAVLVIFAVEFLNTAIEKLADHVTPEHNADIRRIKDFGSAAVFCALCLAGLIWLAAIALRLGLL